MSKSEGKDAGLGSVRALACGFRRPAGILVSGLGEAPSLPSPRGQHPLPLIHRRRGAEQQLVPDREDAEIDDDVAEPHAQQGALAHVHPAPNYAADAN